MRSRRKSESSIVSDKKLRFAHALLHVFSNTFIPRLQGRVTQAAEQRLAAQNEQHHWAKKLLDEEKKVRATKEQLDIVQQEFEVG
jgi:hypothetical protein